MPVMERGAEMDLQKSVLRVQQIGPTPVGTAMLLDNFRGPFPTHQDNLRAVLLLRTHVDAGRRLVEGSGTITLFGGILEVHGLAICVLIVVLGERIYPIYLDPLDPDTVLAFKQIVRQESLFLGAVFEAKELPFRQCALPSGGMFEMFANPPKNLKRWTPAQFARAVEAVQQTFDGDIEGLLDSMYPKCSLAELRFGANLQAGGLTH